MPRKYRSEKPPRLTQEPEQFDNLGLVYRATAWDASLGAEERRSRLWALDLLASVHKASPAETSLATLNRLPTAMQELRPLLKRPPRAFQTCSDASWRNMRRGVFAAMRSCGV